MGTKSILTCIFSIDLAYQKVKKKCGNNKIFIASFSQSRKKAEGTGFEPVIPFRRFRFSKPVHSTALPTLRFRTGRAGAFII